MFAMQFPGFRVTGVDHTHAGMWITVAKTTRADSCPGCGSISGSVHSSYVRRLRDLPILGQPVEIRAVVRRFRCRNQRCSRATFSESLAWLARPYAQRTDRVTRVLKAFIMALSSNTSARLALLIGIRTSPSTLLRTADRATRAIQTPRILGVDDFALRRGKTYGTFLCDLESGRPIDVLPSRASEPLAEWLRSHPGIEVISRDRASAYAQAASQGAPGAVQVADRFHLVRNVSDALREALDQSTWRLPKIAVAPPAPKIEVSSSRANGHSKRELDHLASLKRLRVRHEEVWQRFRDGESIRAIARATGMTRATIRKHLRSMEVPNRAPRSPRPGKLEPFVGYLQERWRAGCRNASQLFGEIKALGYDGSRSLLRAFVKSWRQDDPVNTSAIPRPTWKDVRWAILCPRERLNKSQQDLVHEFLAMHPELREAYDMVHWFRNILSEGDVEGLAQRIDAASRSEFSSFRRLARTFTTDIKAVQAGVELKWSTGKVEGHINRVKLIKRIGYGRAGLGLLRARILWAQVGSDSGQTSFS